MWAVEKHHRYLRTFYRSRPICGKSVEKVSLDLQGLRVLSMNEEICSHFFAMLLFVATMEADGKRMTLEKEPEPSNHQMGRKVDVGAKDGIDLTAVHGAGEDDSDVALLASLNKVTTESRHHFFPNESNPYGHSRP
ncbi:hypothetical protein GOBAR_AA05142 [Gossypium barbadense]|uniref:Uncharacterized protein n=1 Tax=Gossypium barbadense TaxID=3634 RepID=A0A2P5YIN2_GOSBA|nr:hypothetical protein GOBAR_AA05142 [Gossypium barbadense]